MDTNEAITSQTQDAPINHVQIIEAHHSEDYHSDEHFAHSQQDTDMSNAHGNTDAGTSEDVLAQQAQRAEQKETREELRRRTESARDDHVNESLDKLLTKIERTPLNSRRSSLRRLVHLSQHLQRTITEEVFRDGVLQSRVGVENENAKVEVEDLDPSVAETSANQTSSRVLEIVQLARKKRAPKEPTQIRDPPMSPYVAGLMGNVRDVRVQSVAKLFTVSAEIFGVNNLGSTDILCAYDDDVRALLCVLVGEWLELMAISVSTLRVQLMRYEFLSEKASGKRRRAETRVVFESERGNLTLRQLMLSAEEKIYDRQCHRILRLLDIAGIYVLDALISRLLFLVDDPNPFVSHRAISVLQLLYSPAELAAPTGAWRSATPLQPLEQFNYLTAGFERHTPPVALQNTDDTIQSFWTPLKRVDADSDAQFTEPQENSEREGEVSRTKRIEVSGRAMRARLDLVKCKKIPPGLFKAECNFLCAVTGNLAGSLFEQMKYLMDAVNARVFSVRETAANSSSKASSNQNKPFNQDIGAGWVFRALNDTNSNVRIATMTFILLVFKHDREFLTPAVKFALPSLDLLWDHSLYLRLLTTQALIFLSQQLPFKDGAFKRFVPLLLSNDSTRQRIGLRLVSECKPFNQTAIGKALRILMYCAANNPTEVSLEQRTTLMLLDERIDAASVLARNAYEVLPAESITASVETYAAAFGSRLSIVPAAIHHPVFLVYCSFALTLLALAPPKSISDMPFPVLEAILVLRDKVPIVQELADRMSVVPSPYTTALIVQCVGLSGWAKRNLPTKFIRLFAHPNPDVAIYTQQERSVMELNGSYKSDGVELTLGVAQRTLSDMVECLLLVCEKARSREKTQLSNSSYEDEEYKLSVGCDIIRANVTRVHGKRMWTVEVVVEKSSKVSHDFVLKLESKSQKQKPQSCEESLETIGLHRPGTGLRMRVYVDELPVSEGREMTTNTRILQQSPTWLCRVPLRSDSACEFLTQNLVVTLT